MARKPTIHELEAILDEEEDSPIEILPNGEVRALGGSDAAESGYRKPITMREDLGGEYSRQWKTRRESDENPTGYCNRAAALRLRRGAPDQHRRIDGVGRTTDVAPPLHLGRHVPPGISKCDAQGFRPETCAGTVPSSIPRQSSFAICIRAFGTQDVTTSSSSLRERPNG